MPTRHELLHLHPRLPSRRVDELVDVAFVEMAPQELQRREVDLASLDTTEQRRKPSHELHGIETPARLALAHSQAPETEIPHGAAGRLLVDPAVLDLNEMHDQPRDQSAALEAQRRELRDELFIGQMRVLHERSIHPRFSSLAFAS
jgi:hypothetical protein